MAKSPGKDVGHSKDRTIKITEDAPSQDSVSTKVGVDSNQRRVGREPTFRQSLLAVTPFLMMIALMLLSLISYRMFFEGWSQLPENRWLSRMTGRQTFANPWLDSGVQPVSLYATRLKQFTLREDQLRLLALASKSPASTSPSASTSSTMNRRVVGSPHNKTSRIQPRSQHNRRSRHSASNTTGVNSHSQINSRQPKSRWELHQGTSSNRPPLLGRSTDGKLLSASSASSPESEWQKAARSALLKRYAGRVNWVAFVLLQVVTCLVVIWFCLYTIAKALRCESRGGRRLAAMMAVLIAGALASQILYVEYMRDMRAFLEETIGHSGDFGQAWRIIRLTRIFDCLSLFVAILLSLTASFILWPVIKNEEPDSPAKALCLATQLKQLYLLLLLGTAVMVATSLQVVALLQWAMSCINVPQVSDSSLMVDVKSLGTSFVTWRGLIYSLWLASIYLPTGFIMRARAIDLAVQAHVKGPVSEQEEWMQKHGLSLSLSDVVPRIAALLAPVLTGSVADLLQSLSR